MLLILAAVCKEDLESYFLKEDVGTAMIVEYRFYFHKPSASFFVNAFIMPLEKSILIRGKLI